MGHTIILTETQFREYVKKLVCEGVDWGNLNGNVSLHVNNDTTDKGNLSGNYVDTRVFGSRNDILYGDGTNNMLTNLSDVVLGRRAIMTTMLNLIKYIENGRKGALFTDKNIPANTKSSINKWLDTLSDEEIINKAKQAYSYWLDTCKQKEGIYNRANTKDGDKIMRYSIFTINGTNIKCIALFNMKDFSMSDAIKHGEFSKRNPIIDNPDNYKINKNGKIDVVYDNGISSDVASNFSINKDLNNTDHFKTQYQLKNADYNPSMYSNDMMDKEMAKQKDYTSINQFLDKSIIYANYVLKEEDFKPAYIITVPSSSKMNFYYALNLSRKNGSKFLPDFFKRNIINAHLRDGLTDEELLKNGLTEEMIAILKKEIKDYAYQEITYKIEEPIRKLVNDNIDLFSNISKEKNSRDKYDIKKVISLLSKYCFKTIEPVINKDDVIAKHLCRNFLNINGPVQDQNFLNSMLYIITQNIGKKTFDATLFEMKKLFEYYSNEIQVGYHPGTRQYGLGQSKITRIPKAYRQYIEGSFIIADKYAKENSHFFDTLVNENILLIDEDINTGSSFQLSIEALKEKIPYKDDATIMCLANGYSESGNIYR